MIMISMTRYLWILLTIAFSADSTFEFSVPEIEITMPANNLETTSTNGIKLAKQLESMLAQAAEHNTNEGQAFLSRKQAMLRKSPYILSTQPQNDDSKDSRQHLLTSQKLFDAAASQGETNEEKAIKAKLVSAMMFPSSVGKPDRHDNSRVGVTCQPDLTKCPLKWYQRGILCFAPSTYAGPCTSEVDMFEMDAEQKISFARYCNVEFPCQDDCTYDFISSCPSLWREVENNVCEAPAHYTGTCNKLINTSGMSEKDKYTFGIQCGARWPCAPTKLRDYRNICPQRWNLEFGQVCSAPEDYLGPCDHMVHMNGITIPEKKSLEAACEVSWPDAPEQCARDYGAQCPYGWFSIFRKGISECTAPLTYEGCSQVQQFSDMSPFDKQHWEKHCHQKFPCLSRSSCQHDWSALCPANWYIFNGGESCLAPTSYVGNCSSVVNGILDLDLVEKKTFAATCGVDWPCAGEAEQFVTKWNGQNRMLRRSDDPARYSEVNGPVDS